MLDVRPTAYVCPLDEQTIGPITPIIHVENLADENANLTGLVRIYRESLGTLIYSSVLHPTYLAHDTSADISAETEFNPGAPADDDYFILCEITARSTLTGHSETVPLGQFYFDVKPGPMGPAPAAHHVTHEDGGMDPVDLTGMTGLTATPQTPANHATTHEDGNADELNVAGLHGELADDQPALAHGLTDPAKHSGTTPLINLLASVTARTLTDAPNIVVGDLRTLGGAMTVTLGGNRTLDNPTHMVAGMRYSLHIIQDAVGSRLIQVGSAYRSPGGKYFNIWDFLTTDPDSIDIFFFVCDRTGTWMDCFGGSTDIAHPT